jgi:hypothetical protein
MTRPKGNGPFRWEKEAVTTCPAGEEITNPSIFHGLFSMTWGRMPNRSKVSRAGGLIPSPQTLPLGNRSFSNNKTSHPRRARHMAALHPPGPAPTMITSYSLFIQFVSYDSCYGQHGKENTQGKVRNQIRTTKFSEKQCQCECFVSAEKFFGVYSSQALKLKGTAKVS